MFNEKLLGAFITFLLTVLLSGAYSLKVDLVSEMPKHFGTVATKSLAKTTDVITLGAEMYSIYECQKARDFVINNFNHDKYDEMLKVLNQECYAVEIFAKYADKHILN